MNGAVDLTGYHLTFDAEMTSSADLSLFDMNFSNGDQTLYGNYELEYYVNNNPNSPSNPFSFANGALTITATPTPAGGLPYTSGLLTTYSTFTQNTGYFEIRAESPTGVGFWPTFWLLAPDYSSEVDIMEDPNTYGPDTYYTSVKSPTLNTGNFVNVGADVSSGYHTYGFMWTPTAVQFTLDGQYIGSQSATPAALATAKLYLLENLAVGGWGGPPQPGATAQLNIDYIRAYSNNPTVPTAAKEQVSTPDAANLPILPSVGTGRDLLTLQFNEDAYKGDAQFTVLVDGVQQGGTYTASALRSLTQTQSLNIYGTFIGSGKHDVSINFLNDAWGGTSAADRNLYLTQATLNGNALSGGTLNLFNAGSQDFMFGTPLGITPTVVLGSGPDLLALQIAEDAYKGDAQFTISVDGTQIGGVQTAVAPRANGATQAFDVRGNFGKGAHTATVNFLNDANGAAPTDDRNLYLTQASVDNTPIPASGLNEYNSGPQSISFQASSPVNGTVPGASPALLTLHLAEDAYKGDAQFIVSIDGTQLGGVQSVTAIEGKNVTQAFTFADVLSVGTHDVAVSFLNDAWGGTSATDRNLYVLGADLNATALSSTVWSANLYANGTSHFSLVVPS